VSKIEIIETGRRFGKTHIVLKKHPRCVIIETDKRKSYREKFWKIEKEKARKRRQIEIAKMIETVAI